MDNQQSLRPEDRGQEILPELTTLIVLLSIFFTVAIISLLVIISGTGAELERETTGLKAYSPADFTAEIDWSKALNSEPSASEIAPSEGGFPVPPPPFSDEFIFPCSECHDPESPPEDLSPRVLDFHEDIVLQHGSPDRWCLDCHNPVDRDKLRLANGTLVGFDESYRLCGQCHGTIYRDWRMGIHGRRTGYWNGAKSYLLCAHCHDPHKPKFKNLKPLPPPVRPEFLRKPIVGSNDGRP